MPSIEISARTVAEATRLALEQMGVEEDDVLIEVLQNADDENEALVRVSTLDDSVGNEQPTSDTGEDRRKSKSFDPQAAGAEGRRLLEGILERMGVEAYVNIQHDVVKGPQDEDQHNLVLDVEGLDEETVGLLIGRRGETLRSLQLLVNTLVQRRIGRWPQLVIDVGNYRQRRQESLEGLARRIAEQVRKTKQPHTLEAMQPYERRIIHMALRDDVTVHTESSGEGEARRITVFPK
jgi:spoIIIJ-associated protein